MQVLSAFLLQQVSELTQVFEITTFGRFFGKRRYSLAVFVAHIALKHNKIIKYSKTIHLKRAVLALQLKIEPLLMN